MGTEPTADPTSYPGGKCCNDDSCKNNLATGNFFLPANLLAHASSFRKSFRKSFKKTSKENSQLTAQQDDVTSRELEAPSVTDPVSHSSGGVCCNDDSCKNNLATGNFFLPANLLAHASSFRKSLRESFKKTSKENSRPSSQQDDESFKKPPQAQQEGRPPTRPGLQSRSSIRNSMANINASVSSVFEGESTRSVSVRRLISVSRLSERDNAPVVNDEEASRVGHSMITATGICCSSEIPAILSILRPIRGVEEISVNPAVKTIYVDHNVDIVSASDICQTLNDARFGATIVKDAAVEIAQKIGIPTDVVVTTTFDISSGGDGIKAESIEELLRSSFANSISSVTVEESTKTISVEHNPYYVAASQIANPINKYGQLTVSIKKDGGADGLWAISSMKKDDGDCIELQKSSVRITVVLAGVLWIVSMLSHIGGNWKYLKYVALLSIAFGLPPIALKAFQTLGRCKFDVNCMMLFAVIGAVALQDYTEAAAVTFLFAISEWLESLATTRARNALSEIMSLQPEQANLINPITKDIVVLPAKCVAVGSSVSVRPGDKIPCDGIVLDGSSTVDESNLTGESRPVKKQPNMKVSGGTINIGNSQLIVRTTATTNNSAVARLIRLVEEAQSNRSETEQLIDSFAQIYTPIVVLTSLFMCTIPWAFSKETGEYWLYNGLIVIVIACPCALIISTPVTYVAGLAAAAQKGVVIKGGQHLETLGKLKTIAFDKTGTLSEGIFQLLHFNVIGQNRKREEVLAYLSLMEAPASHPLSDAIVKGAANEQVDIPKHLEVKDHTLLPGEGITGLIDSKKVFVGNKKLFDRLGLHEQISKEDATTVDDWAQAGGTIGFISIEGEGIVGSYCVSDKIRTEAKSVIKELKNIGIETTMLTGDQSQAALGVGGLIGLQECDIRSDLLPEEKLVAIQEKVDACQQQKKWWRSKQTVMMVGDGVNDAPALALADVSVAMGEGAALAMETSDVTLMDSNLNKLLFVVNMGPRVIRTIIENVTFSFVVKAFVAGFAFAGKASLWAAIVSDVGAMLIVTLNGMKLLPRKNGSANNEPKKSS